MISKIKHLWNAYVRLHHFIYFCCLNYLSFPSFFLSKCQTNFADLIFDYNPNPKIICNSIWYINWSINIIEKSTKSPLLLNRLIASNIQRIVVTFRKLDIKKKWKSCCCVEWKKLIFDFHVNFIQQKKLYVF